MYKEAFEGFKKPSIAIDTVILRVVIIPGTDGKKAEPQVLVLKDEDERWKIPGGIMRLGDTDRDVLNRISDQKIDSGHVYFEQLYTIADNPLRDERGHIISIVYIGIVGAGHDDIAETDNMKWFSVSKASPIKTNIKNTDDVDIFLFNEASGEEIRAPGDMKYDHFKIIKDAFKRIKGKLLYTDIAFNFIGEKFTLAELESVYESLMFKRIPSFRRMVLDKIEDTGERLRTSARKPSIIYRKRETPADDLEPMEQNELSGETDGGGGGDAIEQDG